MSVRRLLIGLVLLPMLAGCVGTPDDPVTPVPTPAGSPSTPPETVGPSPVTSASPSPAPARFDSAKAMSTIETLAGIGPREATSDGFDEAAAFVRAQLSARGYTVSVQEFEVPAGESWGVPVPAGITYNLIADPPGFDPADPHVVLGAHLDTVPQSPGAEDNASGVAVLLELSRMIAEQPAAVPVRIIIFGAEEPRGPSDELHHFGSTFHVQSDARGRILAMVSLDRVGVAARAVPVAHGGRGSSEVSEALAAHAPVEVSVSENTTSDHWSYEKAGIPAARLGSVPFDGYHSGGDRPSVIDPDQLERTAAVAWAWLRALTG